ncbi:MAG: hypothetical protein K2N56_06035 [Oscillospiraceae bacterium]|nr:hypothetical protein [Oscillospiraceae bacterium]
MAQIPQINNPITSKNYNYSPRQQDANTEPFDIVKLTGVGSAGVNSDSAAKSRLEMGNRELIPLQVQIAKDPTLAVEMLKDLLNVEVLNQALITGHTELYGSLENLAKELYVTPEQLVQEIINQEQQNTMFSGHEFYDVLREVAQTTTDPGTKELIGGLLKSINFAQNRQEILGALRANLKFLSEYYSPNEKLSEKLFNLSQEWGAEDAENYFDYLKGETLSILDDVTGSLLNDDKTQMLIPLIKHNLSRYNNSPYMCKEYFNLLLTQISSGTVREALKNSFNRLYAALFEKKPMQDPQNKWTMEDIGSMSDDDVYNDYTTNRDQNQPFLGETELKNNGFEGVENQNQQSDQFSDENFSENDDDVDLETINNAINASKNQSEEQQTENLTGWQKALNDIMSGRGYSQQLKDSGYNIEHILANYNRGKLSGMDALRMLSEGLFLGDQAYGDNVSEMLAGFGRVNTMQELIDNLNSMLRGMPDIPLRERLYGVFVDIIEKMSVKNELPQHGIRPPVSSTLDNLTDFIQANINNPALKSLDSFNASNLLQSLLNAPGVFTPLAHYILPLDVDGTRAFGELWVDNDENNPNNTPGTQRNYHLFLTFDVESIGRFELDMYALGEEVNISFMYPPRFEKAVDPLKERVNKIVRSSGYQTRAFETAPLKKPHNLVEVFPKITEKRTTLSKRV